MIYSPTKKIVIYSPFKNCSSSLQAYYSNKPKWRSMVGMNPDYNFNRHSHVSSHSAITPPEFDTEYTRFLPIRNPYDRVVSQYHWHLRQCGKISFDEWLLLHSKQPVCQPVTTIYPRYDHLLHAERITEDLRKHGLLIIRDQKELTFPHANKTENPVKVDMTLEQMNFIWFLHYEDFIAGGYPR